MSEQTREPTIDQDEIDHAVRERLRVVVPLLRLLASEEDVELGTFTEDGLSTIRAARSVSWDAAMYLGEEVINESTGHHDISLLYDAQRFFAITSCALKSMRAGGREWIESPHAVRYLLELAEGLQERAEAEEATGEEPKTTPGEQLRDAIPLSEVASTILGYIEPLESVVGRLHMGSGDWHDYVVNVSEGGHRVDRFTPAGARLARQAFGLALDANGAIRKLVGRGIGDHEGLTLEAVERVALAAQALRGVGTADSPCDVTSGVSTILGELRQQCEAAAVEELAPVS
jgi:hypothetical protein